MFCMNNILIMADPIYISIIPLVKYINRICHKPIFFDVTYTTYIAAKCSIKKRKFQLPQHYPIKKFHELLRAQSLKEQLTKAYVIKRLLNHSHPDVFCVHTERVLFTSECMYIHIEYMYTHVYVQYIVTCLHNISRVTMPTVLKSSDRTVWDRRLTLIWAMCSPMWSVWSREHFSKRYLRLELKTREGYKHLLCSPAKNSVLIFHHDKENIVFTFWLKWSWTFSLWVNIIINEDPVHLKMSCHLSQ